MIVEMRIYTIQPGQLSYYLQEIEAFNLVIDEHLTPLIGYFTNEVGTLNQVVSMRAYADFADRSARRKALTADPRFLEAAKRLTPLMQKQENWILQPSSFSPLK
ncbi:NIPSNAP family protein [Bradyrhizobium sp. USDA 3315]